MINPMTFANAFSKVVSTFSKSPLSAVIVVLLSVLIALFIFDRQESTGILSRLLSPSAQEETSFMHKSTKISNKINPIIENARKELNASKILISEFHNNKRGISNVPWNFYSVRYAAKDDAIDYDISQSQDIPNTIMAEFYAGMWPDNSQDTKCLARRTSDIQSSMLRSRVEDRNSNVLYMCPLQTQSGVPIGYITITYNLQNYPKKDDGFYLEYLKELADVLTPFLEDDLQTKN